VRRLLSWQLVPASKTACTNFYPESLTVSRQGHLVNIGHEASFSVAVRMAYGVTGHANFGATLAFHHYYPYLTVAVAFGRI
jgi:hypothetical protein